MIGLKSSSHVVYCFSVTDASVFPCSLQQLQPKDAQGVQVPNITGMLPW